jgi:tRNA(fMet)-specific endonuclease VapC
MILDTNAISDFIRGDLSLTNVLRNLDQICLSPIALGEYLFGAAKSSSRVELVAHLNTLMEVWPTLGITAETSHHYAELRSELHGAGTPLSPNDLWIAAQAREHKMPIITRDADFDKVPGLRRQSW